MNHAIVQRMTHCIPEGEDRTADYRARLWRSPGFNRFAHDADVARGVTWLRDWYRKPLPRHRALTVIDTERGGIRAETDEREHGACAVGESNG